MFSPRTKSYLAQQLESTIHALFCLWQDGNLNNNQVRNGKRVFLLDESSMILGVLLLEKFDKAKWHGDIPPSKTNSKLQLKSKNICDKYFQRDNSFTILLPGRIRHKQMSCA